jgi:hypothetical protein
LRLIAWVALNLVRDQTGDGLGADGAGPAPDAPPPEDSTEARDRRRAILFRDLDAGAFDRPASVPAARPNPFADPSRHPVVGKRRRESEAVAPRLAFSAFFGATQEWSVSNELPVGQMRQGELLQLEAQYSLGGAGVGAAFELWGEDMERKGLAAFTAREWQRKWLRLGGNLGFGFAASDGFAPYVRANVSAGFVVLPQLELGLRFSLHAGPLDVEESQLAYLLGLRLFP